MNEKPARYNFASFAYLKGEYSVDRIEAILEKMAKHAKRFYINEYTIDVNPIWWTEVEQWVLQKYQSLSYTDENGAKSTIFKGQSNEERLERQKKQARGDYERMTPEQQERVRQVLASLGNDSE